MRIKFLSDPGEGARPMEARATELDAAVADGAAEARSRVLECLIAAHEAWFDVERGRELAGRVFPGYAEFHSYGERYVLSRRAKLWEVANHEYIFFDTVERLEEDAFARMVAFMETEALAVVHPEPNHMSSNISLVVVADEVGPQVGRMVRRTRFRKNFKWGLWGWSDLRIAVVDLAGLRTGGQGRVMTNAAGKVLRKTIEANLALAAD